MSPAASITVASRLRGDARGSVMTEYLIVLCLLSIGATTAIAACSVLLLRLFFFQVTLILPPVP